MSTPPIAFGLSFDYRCPSSWITHTHVLDALDDGADWDVRFHPFSLSQSHVEPGETPIWERPGDDSGLEALQVAMAVRDGHAAAFRTVHRGLFDLRHRHGTALSHDAITSVLTDAGLDATSIWDEVATGKPLQVVRNEHTWMADELDMWGVPTFVVGDRAAFVNLRERPTGDAARSRHHIERILGLLTDFDALQEFKHTSPAH